MEYIPSNPAEVKEMLASIGASGIDELFAPIPASARIEKLHLPDGISEHALVKRFQTLAAKNRSLDNLVCFRGAGVYDHFIPTLVEDIISRPEFYTAYTPYQAEASQGTLQTIFEYQSMICALTGLDVANASLYDGATAVAEAVLLAMRTSGRSSVILSAGIHPEYREVVATYLQGIASEIVTIPLVNGATPAAALKQAINEKTAAIVIQSPNFVGTVEEMAVVGTLAAANNALFIAVVNPISLGLLASPQEVGAHIAVGEGQALGNPSGMGGFSFGFMACRKELSWKMPGRIVGQTTDTQGRRGFVLTLQSREQHIRREKATSNICTNAALNALAGCVYMSGWGPDGLRTIAYTNAQKCRYAFEKIIAVPGFSPAFANQIFFNECAVKTTKNIQHLQKLLLKNGILGPMGLARWYPEFADVVLFCVTEIRTKEEIDRLVEVLKQA
ncbi:MAG: aminomethyl-transferring glycine dehydrogenase subunit GcvPA [Elusimicrobia bacterium]|nr:aminomethyl-transferring glycine dehydrogenase subunit GcvPA [Elusimicrobiota bacterium]